ncbi:hypothetical protein Cgig2_019516 [Carnegiea gigantea]|uniref:DUF8040 domain-containing protein n=1 Tax=Carnegiea gigantea TaxID=171969 RepID=A0A9Q1KGH9_9CARY|nr:hypothetical protein Cgig2_019516 [Carnegiea gigantea]
MGHLALVQTNRDDKKLLDILIEQRAQGAVKFEWSLVRVMLKNEGINKESIQIKNRCKIGVGVYYKTGAVRFGGKYKSFRKKVPANLEKMKSAFCGKQATGKVSFVLGMVASPSIQTQQSTGKVIVMKQMRMDLMPIWNDFVQRKVDLLLRVCTALTSEKVKAGLLVMANGSRFLTSHQEMRRRTKPLLYYPHEAGRKATTIPYEAGAGTAEATSPNFYHEIGFHVEFCGEIRGIKRVLDLTVYAEWSRMDEEDCAMDAVEDHAIDTIIAYTQQRNHVDRPQPTIKERLPRAIGGESGAKYIHRLLNGNRPDLYRKVLHLDKDVFTHLVNIFIERRLLKEGLFIKVAEIVAITLFVLVRGASYGEAEDHFQHSPSTIGK